MSSGMDNGVRSPSVILFFKLIQINYEKILYEWQPCEMGVAGGSCCLDSFQFVGPEQ